MTLPSTESAVLETIRADFDTWLAGALAERPIPAALHDAIGYSTFAGGKRLRPALVLLSCEAAGGRRADAMPAAAAIELIHTFSLVHDDLPAMDDDDLRRGRPTLHVHAGEALAILGGDAMVSIAFEMLAEAPLDPTVRVALVRELASGTTAMIRGQIHDTLGGFAPKTPEATQLDEIHRHKTAALIRAACRMGAIVAGGSVTALEALTAYGTALGLMFQVVDDVLDVTQSTEHLGKTAGKDAAAGKLTWPSVHGLDAARQQVDALHRQAVAATSRLGGGASSLLAALAEDMALRTR